MQRISMAILLAYTTANMNLANRKGCKQKYYIRGLGRLPRVDRLAYVTAALNRNEIEVSY